MSQYYYLSFANDTGFLGAAIVIADSPVAAQEKVSLLGINPGGEVAIACAPDGWVPPPTYLYKLLSRSDIDDLDALLPNT